MSIDTVDISTVMQLIYNESMGKSCIEDGRFTDEYIKWCEEKAFRYVNSKL